MRGLHIRSRRRHEQAVATCPKGRTSCVFHEGQCETCGTRLVENVRDEMRERDPRY